jgi:hypothetical protein
MEDIKKAFNRLVRYNEDTKGVESIQYGIKYNADSAIKDIKTVEQALDEYKVLKSLYKPMQVKIKYANDGVYILEKQRCPNCFDEIHVYHGKEFPEVCLNCFQRLKFKEEE